MSTGILRFITAGSVDDGKSTLIGRLLVDARGAFEDQVSSAQRDNERRGGKGIDFALLTDGLKAEREQGITIDIAYRYFNTPRRKFIIADAPGHEEYTRNMITGASTADLALILVDARQGLVTQSKRHAYLTNLVGIRHVIVAVNKMDLVDFKQDVFEKISEEFRTFFERLSPVDIRFIPISALEGDMVVERGNRLPWYRGNTVLESLETIEISRQASSRLRFPIQLARQTRTPMGRIASGCVRVGQWIAVMPGKRQSRVTGITTSEGDSETAFEPQSVTIELEEDLGVSRGDMIVGLENPPRLQTQFDATICWMSSTPMKHGGQYRLRHTTKLTEASVSRIQYRVDPNTIEQQTGISELHRNDIARITVQTTDSLPCDLYRDNRETGAFILIDTNNDSVGAGFIES